MLDAYDVDDLSIVRYGGRDEWEKPLPPTIEAVTGYVEWKTRVLVNDNGKNVLSTGYVLLNYDATITEKDKIMIDGIKHPIISIETLKDFEEAATKVYFQ